MLVHAHMDEDWSSSKDLRLDNRRRSTRNRQVSHAPSDNFSSANSSQKRRSPTNDEPPRKRPQRARKPRPTEVEAELSVEEGLKVLTNGERMSWKGWVELESDPIRFDYILREYGVKGVKIQDASLDDEMLAFIPFGYPIMVSSYRESDDDDENDDPSEIPRDVWFANQTTNNACATVAMLNIVMNTPEIDLGQTLGVFKEETEELEPAYRGKRLAENDFIRNIHNSFARKMDIADVDLSRDTHDKWMKLMKKSKQKKHQPNSRNTKKLNKKPKKTKKVAEEELAYHFIAYAPINGVVWRFDGLQHQPRNLGDADNNWIAVAGQHIEDRMAQYREDGIQFNLLALCKSPLLSIPPKMAEQIKSLKRVEGILDYVKMDWRDFTTSNPTIGQDEEIYGLTKDIMDKIRLSQHSIDLIQNAEGNLEELMRLHQQLWHEIAGSQDAYLNELAVLSKENEEVAILLKDDTATPKEQVEAATPRGQDVHMTGQSTTSRTDSHSTDTPQVPHKEDEAANPTNDDDRMKDDGEPSIAQKSTEMTGAGESEASSTLQEARGRGFETEKDESTSEEQMEDGRETSVDHMSTPPAEETEPSSIMDDAEDANMEANQEVPLSDTKPGNNTPLGGTETEAVAEVTKDSKLQENKEGSNSDVATRAIPPERPGITIPSEENQAKETQIGFQVHAGHENQRGSEEELREIEEEQETPQPSSLDSPEP